MTGKNGIAMVWRVIARFSKCDWRNRLFHFSRPSHFKDCVAIVMRFIVAHFFPFHIEICWLLYCVPHCRCILHSWRSRTTIFFFFFFLFFCFLFFATDEIFEQNSVRHTLKCVLTVTCLIMAMPFLVFFFFFFFLRSAMVVYPCDIHKVSKLLTGTKGKLKKKKKFRPSQW